MSSQLEQIRQMTTIVADTGELEAVKQYKPQDCTTNPSIVLKALTSPEFAADFDDVLRQVNGRKDAVEAAAKALTLKVGAALAALVPGRVSTEVDARLSFDKAASIARAEEIIEGYAAQGIGKERILIKLASTWEGIQAAAELEKRGINCNLTLLFSFAQAQACADAGVYLISPFVGRITDWYSKATGEIYPAWNDPGVLSVKRIYEHYKSHGYRTVVMGASFRNTGQILALAGCDRLTIAPKLLGELEAQTGRVERVLVDNGPSAKAPTKTSEAEFRWELNDDQMATEKLSDGIRLFNADALKLEALIAARLTA